MTPKTMFKFFLGLCSTGCWSCFDEFDRIQIEVLSVVASQLMEIMRAKVANLRRFQLDEMFVSLKSTCNVFVTMNSAYQGRTKLPDNLQILFRPVAMVVPDCCRIAEVTLWAVGFDRSKELA